MMPLTTTPRRGSLLFGSSTAQKITVRRPWNGGSGAALTYWQWFYRTSDINGQGTSFDSTHDILLNGVGGADDTISIIARASVNAEADSVVSAWPQNQWVFTAVTYDESDGPRVFVGTLTAVVTEVSYAARTVGSGATLDTSAVDLVLNNRTASSALSASGTLASAGLITRRLSLQELVNLQYRVKSVRGQRFLYDLRYSNGLTVYDLSGNTRHGRITAATPTTPAPMRTVTPRIVPYTLLYRPSLYTSGTLFATVRKV